MLEAHWNWRLTTVKVSFAATIKRNRTSFYTLVVIQNESTLNILETKKAQTCTNQKNTNYYYISEIDSTAISYLLILSTQLMRACAENGSLQYDILPNDKYKEPSSLEP